MAVGAACGIAHGAVWLLVYIRAVFIDPCGPASSRFGWTSTSRPESRPLRLLLLRYTFPSSNLAGAKTARDHSRPVPDVIVFAGDTLNTPMGLATFRQLMSELVEIAPPSSRGKLGRVYFHDLDLFGGTGVRELSVEGARRRSSAGGSSCARGFAVQGGEAGRWQRKTNLSLPPAGCARPRVSAYSCTTTRSLPYLRVPMERICTLGDTHGGQLRLPGLARSYA